MSEPQTDERIEQDPLLDFSTEPARVSLPESPPNHAQLLPAATFADPLDVLRRRVDQLDMEIERALQQINALRSDAATLVSAEKDIGRRVTSARALRLISASAGVALGIIVSAWFWIATSAEPLVESPAVVAAEPEPNRPVQTVTAPPAIVPAAAVTAGREAELPKPAQPQSTPPPSTPRRVGYVGTLTVDSNPPGEVTIDGRPAGATPVRAEDLKAGSHLIWIQRDGYRRFTRVVQVPANRVTRLSADLEPLPSR